mmetsp:Transcript_8293/g.9507  ORF Transcript_8293/g.9507 Transcript_8293/m.9507 type:complete len:202 (+) Transcript_8293:360-965(+)
MLLRLSPLFLYRGPIEALHVQDGPHRHSGFDHHLVLCWHCLGVSVLSGLEEFLPLLCWCCFTGFGCALDQARPLEGLDAAHDPLRGSWRGSCSTFHLCGDFQGAGLCPAVPSSDVRILWARGLFLRQSFSGMSVARLFRHHWAQPSVLAPVRAVGRCQLGGRMLSHDDRDLRVRGNSTVHDRSTIHSCCRDRLRKKFLKSG